MSASVVSTVHIDKPPEAFEDWQPKLHLGWHLALRTKFQRWVRAGTRKYVESSSTGIKARSCWRCQLQSMSKRPFVISTVRLLLSLVEETVATRFYNNIKPREMVLTERRIFWPMWTAGLWWTMRQRGFTNVLAQEGARAQTNLHSTVQIRSQEPFLQHLRELHRQGRYRHPGQDFGRGWEDAQK